MNLAKLIAPVCLPLVLSLGACDAAAPDEPDTAIAAPALETGTTAGSFQLQAIVELVKGEAVADAAALEIKINDPEAKLNAVDVDEDGKIDFVEVIELHESGKTSLQFRAIPSSKTTQAGKLEKGASAKKVGVVIATIELEIQSEKTLVIHATYTEHITHEVDVHVYHHEEPVIYEGGVIVVSDACFYHYVFVLEHEAYHGHHHHHIVVENHVHVKHTKHKKHKKHKKGKGHHGHKGKGHKGHW